LEVQGDFFSTRNGGEAITQKGKYLISSSVLQM
jgi:hypothetical protein